MTADPGAGLPDETQRRTLDALSALPDDDLFRLLASAEHGAFPQDAVRQGRVVLARATESSRDRICGSPAIRAAVEAGDESALVGAVTDLLLVHFGLVPAATIAVLFVRSGVGRFCAREWSDDRAAGR